MLETAKADGTEQRAQRQTHTHTVNPLIYEKGAIAEEVGRDGLFNKGQQNPPRENEILTI